MSERIEKLSLRIDVAVQRDHVEHMAVAYAPRSGSGLLFEELKDNFIVGDKRLDRELRARLNHMIEFVRAQTERREFEVGKQTGSFSGWLMGVRYNPGSRLLAATLAGPGTPRTRRLRREEVTEAQQRLLDSIAASAERLAWEHLRGSLQVGGQDQFRPEVMISYRATKQDFAEALARRLGQEAIVPFFDKWDVKAGDSVPGKIEEAFARSMACIVVLSEDFKEGQWATAELETAITKHIQEGYQVIPVLYEECKIPELLRPLRYVDFSSHDPQAFESKFGELIDSIYSLELNPFRT